MLGGRPAPLEAHFSGDPVIAALVALTMGATPSDPVALTVAGALVYIGGQIGKRKAAHSRIALECKMRFGAPFTDDLAEAILRLLNL